MTMPKPSSQWLVPIALVAAAAVAAWYYWGRISRPEPEPAMPPTQQEPAAVPGPLHPLEPITDNAEDRPELVPLPPLDQSDAWFKLEVGNLFGTSIEGMLAQSGVIEKVVASVDSLPRTHLAERVRPLAGLEGQFLVDGQDGSGEYAINTDNYHRYDALIETALGADLQQVADVYRRFYPLFQKAYVDLGFPNGYFNDRLVEVIDHLLETPEVSDPVALVRPHVLYEYRDPDLEALSSGQKLLLRMGSAHAAQVKERLREFRALIVAM